MTTETRPSTAVRELSYRMAVNEAMHQEMERDANVFVAGIDLAERGDVFGLTQGLLTKFETPSMPLEWGFRD